MDLVFRVPSESGLLATSAVLEDEADRKVAGKMQAFLTSVPAAAAKNQTFFRW